MTAYVYQEFPKVKYHPKLGTKTVQNTAEEKDLGKGWYNTPAEFPKPSKTTKTLREDVKPWWEEWKWLLTAIGVVVGILVGIITIIKFLHR